VGPSPTAIYSFAAGATASAQVMIRSGVAANIAAIRRGECGKTRLFRFACPGRRSDLRPGFSRLVSYLTRNALVAALSH
jgi:hypothetical protein